MSGRASVPTHAALGQSRPASDATVSSDGKLGPPEARISVGRLRLKVPAADGAAGRRIAERAIELAADRVPAGLSGHFPGLSVKVHPRSLSEAAITEAVADALVTAMRRRGGHRA